MENLCHTGKAKIGIRTSVKIKGETKNDMTTPSI